ncbi:YlbF family regulator [Paenibacillus sp. CAU 1782]
MAVAEYRDSAAHLTGVDAYASLDMASLLLRAYELGDMVNLSAEVAEYAYWKKAVNESAEAKKLQIAFLKAKEQFADCERFGRFHPDFHEARGKLKEAENALGELEEVRRFKLAESAVDDMLHEMATIIAESVSYTIKVPGNEKGGGGCGSGGSCGCGSGGCG